jgi:hypothetical protein
LLFNTEAMKTRFVRYYLLAAGVIFALTAVAKLPAIFHARTWCADAPILGDFQPSISNEQLLGIAATIELVIVLLIFFSRWRWLPCLAAALWGLACVIARWFLMDPFANCRCLGWFIKPNPTTNVEVGLLALGIATGGWIAFRMAWCDAKPFKLQ